jgi:hypothetical protein
MLGVSRTKVPVARTSGVLALCEEHRSCGPGARTPLDAGDPMLTRTLTCRGALTAHRDRSVTCSELSCPTSRSSENALATHSCIVVCHKHDCVRCVTPGGGPGDCLAD